MLGGEQAHPRSVLLLSSELTWLRAQGQRRVRGLCCSLSICISLSCFPGLSRVPGSAAHGYPSSFSPLPHLSLRAAQDPQQQLLFGKGE